MGTNNPTNQNKPARRGSGIERFFTRAHVFLYRLSGGAIGGRFAGCPVFLLTVTGRKSGKPYTTPLLYLRDQERLITVASHGGAPKHPTWWLNLQSTPSALAEIGRQKMRVIASQADPEERARLWPLLVQSYPGYADYQRKTTREIPVVILTPDSTTSGQ